MPEKPRNTPERWQRQALNRILKEALASKSIQRKDDFLWCSIDDPRPDPDFDKGKRQKLNLFSIRVQDDNQLGIDTAWLAQMIQILLDEKFGEAPNA